MLPLKLSFGSGRYPLPVLYLSPAEAGFVDFLYQLMGCVVTIDGLIGQE
jgi:hypothetical protein